jgi:hypothetical protein
VDVGGDGAPSLGDFVVFHDQLLIGGKQVGDEGGTGRYQGVSLRR